MRRSGAGYGRSMKTRHPRSGPDRDSYIVYRRDELGDSFRAIAHDLDVSATRVWQRYYLVKYRRRRQAAAVIPQARNLSLPPDLLRRREEAS